MFQSLKKLYNQFSSREKRTLMAFLLVILISGLIQVVGIASIFPFISVATNPEIINSNPYLSQLKDISGITNQNDFLVFLGSAVLVLLILSNAFMAFTTWLTMKFVVSNTHQFAYRLMQRYLGETYEFHLQRNSAELIKNITMEVGRVVNGGIMSALEIFSKGITSLLILILLVLVDPIVALIVAVLVGGAYILIYYLVRKKLAFLGQRAAVLFGLRHKYVNEALGGVKDLMVLQRQGYYLKQLQDVLQELIATQIRNRTAADLPKYLVETFAFGGILAITIYLISTQDNVQDVMPMIALYGFAGIRLMPAVQAIYKATANLRFDIAAVDIFYNDLKGTPNTPFDANVVENPDRTKMPFKNKISIEEVSFTYPTVTTPALNKLNIEIEKNSSIGIVGTSGSGKSTLVDIILGLLQFNQGRIKIDDVELDSQNIVNWKNDIGYVPQSIFLADATIRENIAFGIPEHLIDHEAIINAAKMANIHDFIENELDDGYDTITGERGIRLSGGQRQRIGIARALYHNPGILIFDEATSALDGTSEKIVIDAVSRLHGQITIIMIAHRLSTVMGCDKLIWLEKGTIKAEGSYAELLQQNTAFQHFAQPQEHQKV